MLDVHVVSHTHWDREWYQTREQFRLRLVDLIDCVLYLLETDSRFEYFHLDGQTIVLEDYLEVRPERGARLRRLIAAQRLLVGPWYVMPDEFLVSGEALVRNLAIGHRIAAEFGTPMPVGYLPDLFGHIAQMPQLLAQFGLNNAILWRGFGGPRAEYWWRAPDGSRVLMLHLPQEGYCNAVRLPLVADRMVERATALLERERARTSVGQVLLMSGVDHVEPHPATPDLIARLSELPGVRARHSTLPAYVDAVRTALRSSGRGGELEEVCGELRGGEHYAPLLPGVLSARTYLKQANARVQAELEKRSEPAALFAWLAGAEYPSGALTYAWKTLIQNHPHDSICGCSIDAVHEENMTRFARAGQVAQGIAERAMAALAGAVEAPPPNTLRCLVFSCVASERSCTGIVEAVVDLPLESAEPRRAIDPEALHAAVTFYPRSATVTSVLGPDGDAVPFQVLSDEEVIVYVMARFETPWAVRARRFHLAWWAVDVPPCGYAAYDVVVTDGSGSQSAERVVRAAGPGDQRRSVVPAIAGDRTLENEHVRVIVNADGTVDVTEKRSGLRFPRCGALEDVGDVGDEYTYSPPARDRRVSCAAHDARVTVVHAGPLRAALRVEVELAVPAGATGDRTARLEETVPLPVAFVLSLDAGSPRILWNGTFENRARDHRLRVLFPLGVNRIETVRADTAFGIVRRPARRPVPAAVSVEAPVSSAPLMSFVDAGHVALFAHGFTEYEVVVAGEDDRMQLALTLLRAVGDLSRDDLATRPCGHAGPAVATPGAQCIGRHEFRYAIEPHAASVPDTSLFTKAATFVAPPCVRVAGGSGGRLPARLSFVNIDDGAGGPARVVLSACKKAEDRETIVVRIFNPGETDASVGLGAWQPVTRAFAIDLLERQQREIQVEQGRVRLTLPPYRIQTLELVVERGV